MPDIIPHFITIPLRMRRRVIVVNAAAKAHKIKWREFDPWSHLMTLVTIQLSKQESLNGICDIAKAMEYEWNRAGLKLPHRNTTIQHAQACVRISLCKAISLLRTALILTLRSSMNWQAAMYSSSHEIYIYVSYWLSAQKTTGDLGYPRPPELFLATYLTSPCLP